MNTAREVVDQSAIKERLIETDYIFINKSMMKLLFIAPRADKNRNVIK